MHFVGSQRPSPQPTSQSKSTTQPVMRRSCHFCRSRKIRCSGQSICSACRERNIDCVYGREGSKGRPKGVASKASARTIHQRSESVTSQPRTKESSPKAHSSSGSSVDFQQAPPIPQAYQNARKIQSADGAKAAPKNSIAADLQQTFNRLFDTPATSTESCPGAIAAFGRKHSESRASLSPTETLPQPAMTYEDPMFTLIEDFVEMVTLRFGDLGCQQLEDRPPPLFKRCLDVDDNQDMFDDFEGQVTNPTNPTLQYNNYQTLQMIDIWFSHHPLAFILSKTLLLRSYRDGTQNNVLLAVILADVNFAERDPELRAKGVEMFRWANSQLFDMLNSSIDLSTVQALTLLGWYELCATRARRSLCYLLHASNIVSGLQAPTTQLNQINGMDVGEVEAELARSIRWLTFAVILWAFMQMDAPILELLPTSLTGCFPPTDESTSLVFKLDTASDNISTLTHQARTIRYLWPICHVASTTAHIYALYPREQTPMDESQTFSWQSKTLLSLRRLNSPQPNTPRNLSFVCSRIRHILVGALELISGCKVSEGLLLAAYHTMIIHFLFPRTQNIGESVPVTDPLIDDFASSARSLLRVSPALDSTYGKGGMTMGLYPSTIAEVFMLGLDACGRGLTQIHARGVGHPESEGHLISAKSGELAKLALDLRCLSKHEKLTKTKRAKGVKKQLKNVLRTFDGQDPEAAKLFDFSNMGSNETFFMDPISNMHLPDLVPSISHSPTVESSSSSTPSRCGSNQGIWPSPLSTFDQTQFAFPNSTYNVNAPFMDASGSRLNWGSADMLDPTVMSDFNTCDPMELENKNFDGGLGIRREGSQVYQKNTTGGAFFDDSAFRTQ